MSNSGPRISSVPNFRELGGQPTRSGRRVRRGRIFRSGQLGALSEPDCTRLTEHGLRTVIDFRGPNSEPAARLPDGAELVALPMHNPARDDEFGEMVKSGNLAGLRRALEDGGAERRMRATTAALVTGRTLEYGAMLRRLADDTALPALLHCSAGKDRTGWAASVVLLALDVDEDEVVGHYLESNDHLRERIESTLARVDGGLDPELVRPFLEVRAEYLHAAFDAVREHFHDFAGYLERGLGVDAAVRERLEAELLE